MAKEPARDHRCIRAPDTHRARTRADTGYRAAAVRSQCGRSTSALITPSAPVVSRLASASAQHVMFPLLTIRTPRTCGTNNHDDECCEPCYKALMTTVRGTDNRTKGY